AFTSSAETIPSVDRQKRSIRLELDGISRPPSDHSISTVLAVDQSILHRPEHRDLPVAPVEPHSTINADRPAHPYPLIGRIISFVPGDELVAERTVDPLEDAYLKDH